MAIQRRGKVWRVVFKQDGKTTYKTFPTEEEAKLFDVALKSKPALITTDAGIKDLIDNFMAYRLGNKRKDTRKNARSILQNILPYLNLETPSEQEIFNYVHRNQYKTSTAKGILKWTRRFLEHLGRDCSKIKWKDLALAVTKEDRAEKNYFTHEDFSKLLTICDKRTSTIYRFMASCGIRVQEMTRLDVSDFNKENFVVMLPAKKAKAKRDRDCVVPVEIRDDFKATTAGFTGSPTDPLFHYDGKRISPNGFSVHFRERCKRAEIGKRNIHLLRAYAVLKIVEGSNGNYVLVKKVCGWDSAEIDRYIGGMMDEKIDLAHNMTFENRQIESSREMDRLVSQIISIYGEDKRVEDISKRTQIPPQFTISFLKNKVSKDIDSLLKLVKALGHTLEIYADKNPKRIL